MRSLHVALSDWHGSSCYDCGRTMSEDEDWFCPSCEHSFCGECSSSCYHCGETRCLNCLAKCAICDEYVCDRCITTCPDCGEVLCTKCLDNGR